MTSIPSSSDDNSVRSLNFKSFDDALLFVGENGKKDNYVIFYHPRKECYEAKRFEKVLPELSSNLMHFSHISSQLTADNLTGKVLFAVFSNTSI